MSEQNLKEGADPIALKFVKFQRCKSVTLFMEESAGGEQLALGGLHFYGFPVATMNMNHFKKQQES
jgi:ribosomal protein L15E